MLTKHECKVNKSLLVLNERIKASVSLSNRGVQKFSFRFVKRNILYIIYFTIAVEINDETNAKKSKPF